MKKTKLWCGSCLAALLSIAALTACAGGGNNGKDEYDKNNRLILNLKNVYFEQWTGEDNYTAILNEKFGVNIKASNYSYNSWDTQVGTAINGNNLTDTIQFNLKSYNFGSSYEKWVDIGMLKALPEDMSKWPNIQKMLNGISNIDYLKINGKLYGIPIANDIDNPTKDFSNMTYVYRRDWAKQLGKYKEGDVICFNGAELDKEKSDKVCMVAMQAIYPFIYAFRRGGNLKNGPYQCTDCGETVKFNIEIDS